MRFFGLQNNSFPQHWIGRDSPIAWLLQSPDITPLNFLLGIRKRRRVWTNVNSLLEFKQKHPNCCKYCLCKHAETCGWNWNINFIFSCYERISCRSIKVVEKLNYSMYSCNCFCCKLLFFLFFFL